MILGLYDILWTTVWRSGKVCWRSGKVKEFCSDWGELSFSSDLDAHFLKPDVCQDFFRFFALGICVKYGVESQGKAAWKSQGISLGLTAGNPVYAFLPIMSYATGLSWSWKIHGRSGILKVSGKVVEPRDGIWKFYQNVMEKSWNLTNRCHIFCKLAALSGSFSKLAQHM